MKSLPCEHCRDIALGGPSKRYPEGEPLVVGRLSYFPYRYKCSRCKMMNRLTAAEFSQLPSAEGELLAVLGL